MVIVVIIVLVIIIIIIILIIIIAITIIFYNIRILLSPSHNNCVQVSKYLYS